ncbi:FAD-dependent oxidoreductase [Gordonia rubripertincta]|uniref:FAD-dependent oxidoreductase n=1 Tax=Gordonia rubripertincta TaxID=36822 RepID=UPI000B8D848E|nr:FAD-dependent oxidoreductase [Gordonia rubripertincta]ASR05579.1 NADH oxidase [Gordonia rubripertincta]
MTYTPRRIVVLGADAAGMSAAHQALRSARSAGEEVEVVGLEKSTYTSYSACGLPYLVAGDVDEFGELVARSPEQHREMGVDLRTGAEVTAVDVNRRTVDYTQDGQVRQISYDDLVVATGARPIFPKWMYDSSGELVPGVGAVKTPEDAEQWIGHFTRKRGTDSDASPETVVVAGGGYIGVEMAEAAKRRGYEVILMTRSRVMSSLDAEMSELIEKELVRAGVRVVTGTEVIGLQRAKETGTVAGISGSDGNFYPCDLVVAALGVAPVTDFLPREVVPMGPSGGIRADADGAVIPGVWAAGDCCETRHRVTGQWTYLPLGTHANKQGRVVGQNLFGAGTAFGGVLGTAITRFSLGDAYIEIGRTGLSTAEATRAGLNAVALSTSGRTASGYMPEATPITTRVIAEKGTRKLLGAQIVGGRGAAKRIDTVAAAVWGGLSVDELAGMDLAYAPPFATVWEAVQLASRRLADRL